MRASTIAGLISIVLAGCSSDTTGEPDMGAPDMAGAEVARGRYLVNNVGLCTFCHTPLNPDGSRDNTRRLGGFDCFIDTDPADPNVGCLSSRNLTNDATGLKNATNAQIKDSFRNGVSIDGKPLAPVMPYWLFHNMTEADADAIVAYLRTVPAVNHTVPANQAPWANLPAPVPSIDPETIPKPPVGSPNYDSAMRGRYLSAQVGLCLDCHTPDLPPGPTVPIDMTKPFGGNRMFFAPQLGFMSPPYPPMIYTANLTQDATGLLGYTAADVKKAVKDGLDRTGGGVCAAAHGLVTSPYAGLEATDLDDIANYIVTLPAVQNMRAMDCVGP